jgi:hypothetical protein
MKFAYSLLFLALVSSLHAQSEPINFGGKTYTLGFSKGNVSSSLKSLHEYVPKGETVENWTSMLARHEFSGISAAQLATDMQKQAKAANAEPSLASSTGSNGQKEFFLDFVMIKPEGTKFTMEWNAWRIMSAPGGAVAVQYAMRGKATPDASEAVLAKLTKDFEKVGTAKALRQLDPDKM